jgi:hypothetical protein
LVIKAVDPADNSFVEIFDDVEIIVCRKGDELICHEVFMKVEINKCQIVIGFAEFIGNLVEVCQSVEVKLFFVVDCGAVAEDDVAVWAARVLQQVQVHLQKSLLAAGVLLALLVEGVNRFLE